MRNESMSCQLTPFQTPLSWSAVIMAWLFMYTRPLYALYQRATLSPGDARLLVQLLLEITRFILLPMFYAYIWRPAPRITIQAPCSDRETMTCDLDVIDKSILHTLSRNPSGCSSRMILQRIGPMYPELEREDVEKHLQALALNNRVAPMKTHLTSPMWIPIKVKEQ